MARAGTVSGIWGCCPRPEVREISFSPLWAPGRPVSEPAVRFRRPLSWFAGGQAAGPRKAEHRGTPTAVPRVQVRHQRPAYLPGPPYQGLSFSICIWGDCKPQSRAGESGLCPRLGWRVRVLGYDRWSKMRAGQRSGGLFASV